MENSNESDDASGNANDAAADVRRASNGDGRRYAMPVLRPTNANADEHGIGSEHTRSAANAARPERHELHARRLDGPLMSCSVSKGKYDVFIASCEI